MGRPPVFSKVHPRFKTPYISTALTGMAVAVAAALVPIDVLSVLTSMGTLLAFVIVSIGVLVLRQTAPELPRPFRTPGMPWVRRGGVPVLDDRVAWTTWERLIVWLIGGFGVYFGYGRRAAARVRQLAVSGVR